jgi:hypothetical protein
LRVARLLAVLAAKAACRKLFLCNYFALHYFAVKKSRRGQKLDEYICRATQTQRIHSQHRSAKARRQRINLTHPRIMKSSLLLLALLACMGAHACQARGALALCVFLACVAVFGDQACAVCACAVR